MKRIFVVTLMFVICALFSQCRKPVFPDFSGDGQRQTITFTTGDDGSKGDFFQGESSSSDYNKLKYKWKSGDVVYVYASVTGSFDSDGVYCGVLNLDNGSIDQTLGTFKGEIVIPSGMIKNSSKLRFYHLGSDVAFNSTAHTASVSFETQNGEITGGNSVSSKVVGLTKDVTYNGGGTYSGSDCKLKVQFAVVKVNLESFGSDPVAVNTVVNTGISINDHGVISYTTGSSMWLNNKTGDYYVVFVPDAVTPVSKESKVYSFENATKIAKITMDVNSGGFYTLNGTGEAATLNAEPKVKGVLPGKFSVSATKQVQFSQGNLQWSANDGGSSPTTHAVVGGSTAAGTWRFAEHQYDYVGDDTKGNVYYGDNIKCNNKEIAETYPGWIDFFVFGSSGFNSRVPWKIDFAVISSHISGTNYDWGVYNAISNGGNEPGLWLTLYKEEMEWITGRTKKNSDNKDCNLYTCGKVNDVNGLLLFPDDWDVNSGDITYGINNNYNQTFSESTSPKWSDMEAAGAVFLPAGGYRYLDNYYHYSNIGTWSCYWTGSTKSIVSYYPYAGYNLCSTGTGKLECAVLGQSGGLCVRLVCNAKSNGLGSADPFLPGDWN